MRFSNKVSICKRQFNLYQQNIQICLASVSDQILFSILNQTPPFILNNPSFGSSSKSPLLDLGDATRRWFLRRCTRKIFIFRVAYLCAGHALGPWPKNMYPNLFGLFSGNQLLGSNFSGFTKFFLSFSIGVK